MSRTAYTEPQCLYKGDLYLYFYQEATTLNSADKYKYFETCCILLLGNERTWKAEH